MMYVKRHFQQYFSYIMAASVPINAYLEFFKPLFRTIFFPSHWLLSHITIVETTDSGERGMNPVTMTIFKNICQAGDQTSGLLFSSLQYYGLSY